MAGAPKPSAAIYQPVGATGPGPAGRGRGGSSARPTPYQANVSSALRDPKASGRGRGAGRGRGRGAGPTSKTWRKPESTAPTSNHGGAGAGAGANGSVGSAKASPFAQLRQNNPGSSPSPFGQPSPQPFSGFGKASPTPFGSSSTFNGTTVDFSRDPRKQKPSKTALGNAVNGSGSGVAVEDLSVLSSYTERYEQLKIDRARERERAIKAGQMADPNQPTNLNQAITPVGTCTTMCPEFERVERIVQKMVDKSEKFLHPSTNSLQNMETKMLKRFRRSAAGYDEQLPSDIRTPKTLLQTMNYLIRHVLGGPEPLGLIHKFVWDRTRSIRNDLSVQQLTQEEHVRMAVTCLERIARFHIVSLHLLSSPANEEQFDRHQEREQLNNTMLSLIYYYDDNRDLIRFPNEAEFRAYYIVFSIHDQRPDLEARVQKWPAELRNSPQVKLALELLATAGNTWEYQGTLDAKRPNAIAQGFYARFFSLVDSPAVSYLLACVAEIYFNHLRQTAIRSIWKGYCRYPSSQQHKNEEWTVDELTTVLYFDDDDQTIKFCEEQDLAFAENANGDLYLNWGSRPVDSIAFQPSSEHSFSERYVEAKRGGRTLVAVILGLNIKEAANLGMIDSSFLSERLSTLASNTANDDSLFVSDEGNEVPSPSLQPNGFFTQGAVSHQTPSPAPDVTNVFGMPPRTTTPSGTPPPQAPFTQTSSAPQPPQPPQNNAFSSLFSPAGSVASTSTAFGTSSSNPFASLHRQSTEAPAAAPAAAPSPFSFPTAPPTQQSPFAFPKGPSPTTQEESKEAPPAASAASSSPFSFPTAPSTQQSPFSFPKGPSQTPQAESKEAPKIPSTSPVSNTSSVFPPPPPSTSSPFATSATTPAFQLGGSSPFAAKQPTSVFDTAKPPSFESSTSSFSLFKSSAETIAPSTQQEQKPVQGMPSPQPSAVFSPAPKQDDTPKKSLFSFEPNDQPVKPVEPAIPSKESEITPPGDSRTLGKDTSTDHSLIDQGVSVADENTTPKEVPPPSENKTDMSALFSLSAPVTAHEKDVQDNESLLTQPIADEKLLASLEETGQDGTWIEALKAAAENRRRTSSTSRKRVLDEQEKQAPVENGAKPTKVSKPAAPLRKKKSMALSSIKPLPKLPILEQVESMISRKPAAEQKPDPPKPNHQVDEDELLLSAARIAAESLRSGPRLLDSWSTPPDTRRSSFSPHNSVMSPMSFSRSQSPHSSSVHGYDMALAPDTDLGLGRTLSRTEQRLRLTGGKGLAYKPLDFTPKKQRKWE